MWFFYHKSRGKRIGKSFHPTFFNRRPSILYVLTTKKNISLWAGHWESLRLGKISPSVSTDERVNYFDGVWMSNNDSLFRNGITCYCVAIKLCTFEFCSIIYWDRCRFPIAKYQWSKFLNDFVQKRCGLNVSDESACWQVYLFLN